MKHINLAAFFLTLLLLLPLCAPAEEVPFGMLKKKPRVYIFANYQDYLDNLKGLGYNVNDTGGIAIPRSARKPAEIYSFLSNNLLDEVLPHEITHLLFKEVVRVNEALYSTYYPRLKDVSQLNYAWLKFLKK